MRSPLDSVLLQILELGLEVDKLQLIDSPSLVQWVGAFQRLRKLRAVEADKTLTALGRKLAKLPLEPTLGYLLLTARSSYPAIWRDIAVIVALLCVQTVLTPIDLTSMSER